MKGENILFVGFFFNHRNHRDFLSHEYENYDQYIESILFFLDTLPHENLFFVTNKEIYDFIKNSGRKTDNILILELEDTETYKRYYDLLNHNFPSTDQNIIKTHVIWHFKFELIDMCRKRFHFDYLCYIDSGIFRPGRFGFIQNFINSGLKFNRLNDVVINYKHEYMDMDINLTALLQHGSYEIPCNSFILKKSIIECVNQDYFKKLDDLISLGINTTEQRVLTLVMRDLWIVHPNKFSLLMGDGPSYNVNYHL